MIVDFHTHAFPDNLAPKAISVLDSEAGGIYPPVSDGTVKGLVDNMDRFDIDVSVVLPVVTKQSQFVKINEWSAGICSGRITGFGGIYPHTDDYKRDIDFIVSLGLKGIKFHAEYQDFYVDDEQMIKIYDYALGKDLILLHHAGFDPAYPAPFKSSPERFARVERTLNGGTVILAHLGGHAQWDDVEEYIAGGSLYLDTSMGFGYYSREQFLRIVKKHGSDKILFASDAPWSDAGNELNCLRSLPLSQNDIDAISGGNAERLLGI